MTSVVARYLASWGNLDQTEMLAAALGRRHRLVHGVCPPGVDVLTTTLAGTSVRFHLLRAHTLVGYALSALPTTVAKDIVKQVTVGNDAGLFRLLHLTALRSTFVQFYQYCADCVEEQVAAGDEPFWHRLLQLHGVSRCPHHRTELFASDVPLLARKPAELRAASSVLSWKPSAPRQRVNGVFSSELQEHLIYLASMTLSTNAFGTSFRREDIARMLRRLGYSAPRGQVSANALSADFRSFLRTHAATGCGLSSEPWWLGMYTATSKSVAPLARHVFMVFLRLKLEEQDVR